MIPRTNDFFGGYFSAMGLNEAIAIRTAKVGATKGLQATTLALSLILALPVGITACFYCHSFWASLGKIICY